MSGTSENNNVQRLTMSETSENNSVQKLCTHRKDHVPANVNVSIFDLIKIEGETDNHASTIQKADNCQTISEGTLIKPVARIANSPMGNIDPEDKTTGVLEPLITFQRVYRTKTITEKDYLRLSYWVSGIGFSVTTVWFVATYVACGILIEHQSLKPSEFSPGVLPIFQLINIGSTALLTIVLSGLCLWKAQYSLVKTRGKRNSAGLSHEEERSYEYGGNVNDYTDLGYSNKAPATGQPKKKPLPSTSMYDKNRSDSSSLYDSLNRSGASRTLSSDSFAHPRDGSVTDKEAQKRAEYDRTITVYGFGPEKIATVLTYLEYSGKVEESWSTDDLKNGIHVRFDTETSARRALGKKGVMVDSETMIGVCPYDPSRHQSQRKAKVATGNVGVDRFDLHALDYADRARDEYRINPKYTDTGRCWGYINSILDWMFGF
ncbi:hypothetical protein SARC_08861 [Sphaeroforma arctica JP610]|uniref:RRM Nup35-type domain-containing protein n=1 Tax=Sphaeroforma arctica JP610 TaxID=667725 RepID=A0A0L0FPJ2_9EUKA|nr:hypothetical protein SARC_08861 [Sphaeroforma arctica JP610]KNC78722.1 hypothetical protein SARC_08861 [Sphaeroforma arctica JP610]|eukprot:XP_014152624.1 hypothetical protein SARC_08861 [Sphaeroforma arctica JP610]